MSDNKPFAFVLMPFAKQFDDIYKLGIKELCQDMDVVAERVDEQHFTDLILERIHRQIENADIIIAEMTGQNPNVFYEVGYAHAKGKLCALITQSASDIPFDLKQYTHIIYDGSVTDLRDKLTPKIDWLKSEVEKNKRQQLSISYSVGSGFLRDRQYKHTGEFDLNITIRNETDTRSPEIEGYYITTSRDWKLETQGAQCPSDSFDDDEGRKLRRHQVHPKASRLSPSAFEKLRISFKRAFWNKYDGSEPKELYRAKGTLTLEVMTSEGTLQYEIPLDVEFSEVPF